MANRIVHPEEGRSMAATRPRIICMIERINLVRLGEGTPPLQFPSLKAVRSAFHALTRWNSKRRNTTDGQ